MIEYIKASVVIAGSVLFCNCVLWTVEFVHLFVDTRIVDITISLVFSNIVFIVALYIFKRMDGRWND